MLFDCSDAAGIKDMFAKVNTPDFLDHMAKAFDLKAGSRLGTKCPEELSDFLKTALGNYPLRMIADALNKVGVLNGIGYSVSQSHVSNQTKVWRGPNAQPSYSKPGYRGKNWRYFEKLAETAAQQAVVPVAPEAAAAVPDETVAALPAEEAASTEAPVPVVQKKTMESLLGTSYEYSAEAAVAEPDLLEKFSIDELIADDPIIMADLAAQKAEENQQDEDFESEDAESEVVA